MNPILLGLASLGALAAISTAKAPDASALQPGEGSMTRDVQVDDAGDETVVNVIGFMD